VAKSSFAGKSLETFGVSLDIPFVFNRKESKFNITNLKASATALNLNITNGKFETDAPSFFGQGFIDLKKRRVKISRARIEMHPFPPFNIAAEAGLDPQDSKSFSLQSSGISFQSLMDFPPFAIPQEVNDWEPEGRLNIHIKAHDSFQEKEKVWKGSAKLEAFDVKFHDPSFAVAGEALRPNLTLEGTLHRPLKEIPFKAKVELSHGESLWKDFYVDWSKMPLQSTISGRFQVSQGKLTDLSMGATIPDFGEIDATGNIDLQEPRSVDLRVMASAFRLTSLYAFISQRRIDSLKQAELIGKAESQIEVKINKNAFSIRGYLKAKDASWADGDKNFSFQGIEAHLPVHYERNATRTEDKIEAPEKGYLIFQKFRSSFLDLPLLKLDITSKRNGYLIQPFKLEIFGQKADVGETSIEYGSNPLNYKALTSFSWKEGDLSQLPFSTQDFKMKGRLSVDLPIVEISPDYVSTEGQGEVNAFGGNIAIKNIQVKQPFSKNRTISCDVKLSGLDLEKITDSIPFGRVTGIINGEIQDLALSYGQPERFNIRIESERRKGVPQRFSLKATNDLAILGTGEKTPFSPQSGWTQFVKEFRYEKIGIACLLENDIFSLQGTIQKKGVEYLVRGSGLFAINVVNKQARNQILFKDMLSRLKRIGQSKQSP
jgi:hypothetical protein